MIGENKFDAKAIIDNLKKIEVSEVVEPQKENICIQLAQLIDKAATKKELRNILVRCWYSIQMSQVPNYTLDKAKEEIIKNAVEQIIARYFDTESILSPNKGLLLFGDVGCGKSTLIRSLAKFDLLLRLITRNDMYTFDKIDEGNYYSSCKREALHYQSTGSDDFKHNLLYANMTFDELGREPLMCYRYKNEIKFMEAIICDRYDVFIKRKSTNNQLVTNFTTNLLQSKIFEVYGEHVNDRLVEMCEIIEFNGISKRK